ncbi:MAG: 4-alpha-glucanotransferase [Lachnospiraceae bacterium]|nr:4-alpha-glucanotransferase [Lachnospiraceae bacterium]
MSKRAAGILLPISSLPSKYGIGTLGKEAFRFVDQLVKAGQKYWQVLPVGPTSFGDSPYQSFSAFAGNPYFIDFEILMEKGLITEKDVEAYDWGADPTDIDYEKLYNSRFKVLRKAYRASHFKKEKDYQRFVKRNKYWLDDYSLYMALKFYFGGKEWLAWEKDIRMRTKEAVEKYKKILQKEIDFWRFCQYEFFTQWKALKKYANKHNIKIIGDIPLYVALDSADVWTHGRLFELDERKNPINVAGVPPDCFSADGQLWGNPLYNWKRMQKDNFKWWEMRMRSNAALYDVIRIDHFIGIVNFWSVPAGSKTAVKGKWRKGPGKRLTDVIKKATKGSDIIAEDLGIVGDNVRALIQKTGWPGMKILQFAYDGDSKNEYLPHNFKSTNCIAYGGTHDNETLVGYYKNKKDKEMEYVYKALNITSKKELPQAVLRAAYSSIADTAIFQMQDILELDNSARMNLPATVGTNWRWRMLPKQFTKEHIKMLHGLCKTYNR